jgi:hypothetical protein
MNFADESACLTADNVRNEVVTIHKSQEVLKMLSYLHVDIFAIVSLKKHVQQSFLHLQQLSLDGFSNCVAVFALDFDTLQSLELDVSVIF